MHAYIHTCTKCIHICTYTYTGSVIYAGQCGGALNGLFTGHVVEGRLTGMPWFMGSSFESPELPSGKTQGIRVNAYVWLQTRYQYSYRWIGRWIHR